MIRWVVLGALAALAGDFSSGQAVPAGPPTPGLLRFGQILDDVKCAADPSQSYALYVPSYYSAAREWPVIFAFDPGARGRNPVERYQAAAERYGYIVAGSNNSRNGAPLGTSISSMSEDAGARFAIDAKRIYLAGMSGGSRVALGLALGHTVAGVIASSAGYPDEKVRKTLAFPLFSTAGTEDFNYREMQKLNRDLTTPHRLAVFEGGHLWLSSDLAMEAVEWMELQAMKAGVKPRDPAEIDQIFAKRSAAVASQKTDKDAFLELKSLAADFDGFKDIAPFAARAAALEHAQSVVSAFKKDRDEEAREERMTRDILSAEELLSDPGQRPVALISLRGDWKRLAAAAKNPNDSPERRLARRVMSGLALDARTRIKDAEYLKMVSEYRPAFPGRRGQ